MGTNIPTNAISHEEIFNEEIFLGDEVNLLAGSENYAYNLDFAEHRDAYRLFPNEEVLHPIPDHHVIDDHVPDNVDNDLYERPRHIELDVQNGNEEVGRKRADNIILHANEVIPRNLIELIPGQRDNSEIFFVNKTSVFHRDWSTFGMLKCSQRILQDCPACIRITPEGDFVLERDHNGHHEKTELLELMEIKEFVKRQELNTDHEPNQIYAEIVGMRESIGEEFSQLACYSLVTRTRKKNRPLITNDLQNLSALLEEYQFSIDIYKGEVEQDGKRAFLFTDNQIIVELDRSQHIDVSSTMKVGINSPIINQMQIIGIHSDHAIIPAIYILLENETESLFDRIFRKVKELAPNLVHSLKTVITTYDKRLLTAIHQQFSDAQRLTCRFYFHQAITKSWIGCGLAQFPREALWKCWTLPDLFANIWDATFELIITDLRGLSEQTASALPFIDYLTQQWQRNVDIVLVENEYMRINLLIQTFYKLITKKFTRKNYDIYQFIDSLRGMMKTTRAELNDVLQEIHKPLPGAYSMRSEKTRIRRTRSLYETFQRFNVKELLSVIMDSEVRKCITNTHFRSVEPSHPEEWQIQVADREDVRLMTGDHELANRIPDDNPFPGPVLFWDADEVEPPVPDPRRKRRRHH